MSTMISDCLDLCSNFINFYYASRGKLFNVKNGYNKVPMSFVEGLRKIWSQVCSVHVRFPAIIIIIHISWTPMLSTYQKFIFDMHCCRYRDGTNMVTDSRNGQFGKFLIVRFCGAEHKSHLSRKVCKCWNKQGSLSSASET